MRKTKGEKIFSIINAIVMMFIVIVMLYPYWNQVAIALNEGMDSMRGGITLWPRKFTLINFQTVMSDDGFLKSILVTVSSLLLKVTLSLTVTFAAAYVLSKRGLKFRRPITLYFLLPNYIHAGVIPGFILFRYLGLIDSYWVYVIPSLFVSYNMIMTRSFLQDIPASVEESAMLDGANEIIIMFKIVVPMSMPIIATITLWTSVNCWNDWVTCLTYITDSDLYTMQFILMQMVKQSERAAQMAMEMSMNKSAESVVLPTSQAVQSAALVVTTLPIIMVYPFLQKYFVKGVRLGAVKE